MPLNSADLKKSISANSIALWAVDDIPIDENFSPPENWLKSVRGMRDLILISIQFDIDVSLKEEGALDPVLSHPFASLSKMRQARYAALENLGQIINKYGADDLDSDVRKAICDSADIQHKVPMGDRSEFLQGVVQATSIIQQDLVNGLNEEMSSIHNCYIERGAHMAKALTGNGFGLNPITNPDYLKSPDKTYGQSLVVIADILPGLLNGESAGVEEIFDKRDEGYELNIDALASDIDASIQSPPEIKKHARLYIAKSSLSVQAGDDSVPAHISAVSETLESVSSVYNEKLSELKKQESDLASVDAALTEDVAYLGDVKSSLEKVYEGATVYYEKFNQILEDHVEISQRSSASMGM